MPDDVAAGDKLGAVLMSATIVIEVDLRRPEGGAAGGSDVDCIFQADPIPSGAHIWLTVGTRCDPSVEAVAHLKAIATRCAVEVCATTASAGLAWCDAIAYGNQAA